MKDKFVLGAAHSHALEMAMNREGNGQWTNELLHKAVQGNNLGVFHDLLTGRGRFSRFIDCSTDIIPPDGYQVHLHRKHGFVDLTNLEIVNTVSEHRERPVYGGSVFDKFKNVGLNANVITFFLRNQHLYPGQWKRVDWDEREVWDGPVNIVCFGTIFFAKIDENEVFLPYLFEEKQTIRSSGSFENLFVRFMRWDIEDNCLKTGFLGLNQRHFRRFCKALVLKR